MSVNLCEFRRKVHQLQDDLEAFVHVVLYTAFRYVQTPMQGGDLKQFLQDVYRDESSTKKRELLTCPEKTFTQPIVFPNSPPLTKWVSKACEYGKQWIQSPFTEITIDEDGTHLAHPGTVPSDIAFCNHHALADLWRKILADEDWTGVAQIAANDNTPSDTQLKAPVPLFDEDCPMWLAIACAKHRAAGDGSDMKRKRNSSGAECGPSRKRSRSF